MSNLYFKGDTDFDVAYKTQSFLCSSTLIISIVLTGIVLIHFLRVIIAFLFKKIVTFFFVLS